MTRSWMRRWVTYAVDRATGEPWSPAVAPSSTGERRVASSVVLSGGLHVGVAIAIALAVQLAQSFGHHGDDGENGRRGAGGTRIEFSVLGPPTEQPAPVALRPSAPSPAVRASHTTPPARATTHAHTASTHALAARLAASGDVASAAHGAPANDAPGARSAVANGGTEASVTESGLRPGSVEHQRAILPAARACADPVAGVWRALKYEPGRGSWFAATLRIHRRSDDTLSGAIVAWLWDGRPDDVHAPACGVGTYDYSVYMQGEGRLDGRRVAFGANTWSPGVTLCGLRMLTLSYNPDHFTGSIDPATQEILAVDNDGGRFVDEPLVFRRVGCLPDEESDPDPAPARPEVTPTPPEVTPEHELLGTMPHFE